MDAESEMPPSLKDPGLFRQQCFAFGKWMDASDGASMPVTNPADGAILGTVPVMGAEDIQHVVSGAGDAYTDWRQRTAKERAVVLRRWHDVILDNLADLSTLMTLEQGKPLAESKGEIAYAASFIEWFAEEAKRIYGDTVPTPLAGNRIVVLKEPVGVCAAITPWNFPAAMITRKAGPALAAGCTMVVKPARQTPFSALALAVLAERAGVPKGVFNVVTGDAEVIGKGLTEHPTVRKLSFTGSTAVGKRLMRDCAATVKKLSLELGGNAPFIVFDDADCDAAVAGAIASKYRNAGQTCVCANRILVQDGIYERFVKEFSAAVNHLRVGPGLDDGIEQGPLIDANALDKVEELIEDALADGARVLVGGRRHALGGTFFEPTVLADVVATMRIAGEEIFGPVAPIFRFSTEKEAIRMANDTPYGLAAYFYTRDVGRVWRVSESIEYGIVGVNTGIISTEVAPFGGMKESGIGREGSRYGIDEYLEVKYVCLSGIDR
ncbi:Succinate-semialdehyde dehydrogenase [NAD(P)+] (EC [Olavius algarvensis associated proteobacterium Delta 3]|nr:Succinate-semialdehyde dehydrogenase [NAD(P)+] (EC [Olavius algarvensis associated proteobacterium Delta 3]CAB5169342.1 Succinate-semialdehyde dehydrogenase [NAD(P)+] (EC [Olavius algarvensis associated proteobacterium Delta 3]